MDRETYREVLTVAGELACEVCGKRAPGVAIDVRLVIPESCGGAEDSGNLVALCVRHAHAADEKWNRIPGVYEGPRSPAALIRDLKQDEAILQLLGAILSPGDSRN